MISRSPPGLQPTSAIKFTSASGKYPERRKSCTSISGSFAPTAAPSRTASSTASLFLAINSCQVAVMHRTILIRHRKPHHRLNALLRRKLPPPPLAPVPKRPLRLLRLLPHRRKLRGRLPRFIRRPLREQLVEVLLVNIQPH